MTTQSKVKPPVAKGVKPPPTKGVKPPSTPKAKGAGTGLKGSANRVIAWAKKNPALAALLIGGVILLAIIATRSKGTGVATARDKSSTGDGEDVMGGLGGLGLESYQEPIWSDFLFPDIPLLEEPQYDYWYPEEEELAQSSTFYPEEELDREYYLERAHLLEAVAGETEDPYLRGLFADAARLTGLGSLTEKDWETEERLRREWEERQRGMGATTTRRSTTQSTITTISPLQYLINQFKKVLTPRATTPSTISERRYTLPSTYTSPSTQPSTPTIGPSITPTYDTSTYGGQMDLYQSIISGRQTEPVKPIYQGGIQVN